MLREMLENFVAVLVVTVGMWLIVGTFTFPAMPGWYVVAHCVAGFLYVCCVPPLTKKYVGRTNDT